MRKTGGSAIVEQWSRTMTIDILFSFGHAAFVLKNLIFSVSIGQKLGDFFRIGGTRTEQVHLFYAVNYP
jgi:hypothetical protein